MALPKFFTDRNTVWGILHFTLGFIHFAFGIGVWIGLSDTIDDTGQEIYFMQPSINQDEGSSTFSVDLRRVELGHVSPILVHAVVSVITSFSHFTSYAIYKTHGLSPSRPNHIRWIEYSITATLMTFSAMISLGEGDILFITSIAIAGILLQSCGWLIEKTCVLPGSTSDDEPTYKKIWFSFFILGVVIEMAIVLPLVVLTATIENKKTGIDESIIFYTFYYALFAVNSFYDARVMTMAQDSISVDENNEPYDKAFMLTDERYAVLSFTSKQALFWITIGMVMRQSSSTSEGEDAWYSGAILMGMILPLVGLIWYALYMQNPNQFGLLNRLWRRLETKSPTRNYKAFPKPASLSEIGQNTTVSISKNKTRHRTHTSTRSTSLDQTGTRHKLRF